MHIGTFLRSYREHFDKSQREFAMILGIGYAGKKRLEKWEQIKGAPKEEDAELIKKFFSVDKLSELDETYLKQIIAEDVPRETKLQMNEDDQPYDKTAPRLLTMLEKAKMGLFLQAALR